MIRFHDHTILIGPNNSGKTTIMEALALVLGRDRLIRALTEHDFYGSDPEPATRIKITATLAGFEPDDFRAHNAWFREGRAVPSWFDPQTGTVHTERTDDRQLLACQIVFAARFDTEALEVETARYFGDDDDLDVFGDEATVNVPGQLIREVGLFLIPANRTWDRMLSFSSELFRRVVRLSDSLPAESVLQERNRLRAPNTRLEEDERLHPLVQEVNEETTRLLGTPASLCFRLTPTDSQGVLEAVTPHFQTVLGSLTPSGRQGSGIVSLQSLLLLLHLARRRDESGESFLMALEEPELHLPPAVQRRILARLQALSTQTIISTHSPLMAGYCDPSSLMIVRNCEGPLQTRALLGEPLGQDATNAVRRLFQINRVETASAVMHDCILVPEGRYDFDWLAMLLRVAELEHDDEQPCLFGLSVGVVPTDAAKVKETCEMLAKAHPQVVALVDGDAAGIQYAEVLGELEAGARRILRWPDEWTIEDVVCWIIEADEAAVIQALKEDLVPPPDGLEILRTRLKSQDRTQHGMKGDGVAYGIVANVLSETPGCRDRTRAVLHAMAEICSGRETAYFVAENNDNGRIPTFVFTP